MNIRDQIKKGMPVFTSDGEKLGKVVEYGMDNFIIEKGLFFTKDYLVTYDEVADCRNGEIWLGADKKHFLEGMASKEGYKGYAEAKPSYTQETRVPLAEEELSAEKRSYEAGGVRIKKDVVTEEKQVTVPVTREEIHVERTAASRPAESGEATFQEGEIKVPIIEEEVEIRKRPVVREELKVSKSSHEERRTASEEVKKEIAEVKDESGKTMSEPDYEK